jgi:S-DNA-T family DNA segregation ATPase FtsK/SpoIIIE
MRLGIGDNTVANMAVSGFRLALGRMGWLASWVIRHRRWLAVWLLLAAVVWLVGGPSAGFVLMTSIGFGPALFGCVWSALSPRSYERLVEGPWRALSWRRMIRRRWQAWAQVCGLADMHPMRTLADPSGRPHGQIRWVAPRLLRVRVRRQVVELTIRARAGQTLSELEAGAERIATTLAAVAHRVRPVNGSGSGCTVVVELVMRDVLGHPVDATEPEPRAVAERVRLGRTQAGGDWWLQLRGRHTLIAGCSGSGKGSVLWGVCCGLAPAVRGDLVRLWGVDLKRGVELATGAGLFSARAYTPSEALGVLRSLMWVIDERGARMAGVTRLHEPVVGNPLHVLVIDELAALTAYADLEVRREATRLLSEILTQGRALGVVVVACVQDPRKDVVAMRGLFTQTIALRLRSTEETLMVLGDGMTRIAPAHRISPIHPGTAWVVEDTGAADRVRADFWPDALIRDLSRRYATGVRHDGPPSPSPSPPPSSPPAPSATHAAGSRGVADVSRMSDVDRSRSTRGERRARKPRSARTPRSARRPGADVVDFPDGAA